MAWHHSDVYNHQVVKPNDKRRSLSTSFTTASLCPILLNMECFQYYCLRIMQCGKVATGVPQTTVLAFNQVSHAHKKIMSQELRCCCSYFLWGLANSEGGMSSWLSPLTENSLSARCCSVPPHLSPRHIRATFSTSRPTCSRSSAVS